MSSTTRIKFNSSTKNQREPLETAVSCGQTPQKKRKKKEKEEEEEEEEEKQSAA